YIKTSPVHIFGSEKDIRYFFYQYFYEKYSPLESTYKKIDLTAMDHLLYFIIEYLSYPIDFASFQLLKITSFVNLIRFSHGHSINTMNIKINNLDRSEEHTSELQSRFDIVCRLLLEKKNNNT